MAECKSSEGSGLGLLPNLKAPFPPPPSLTPPPTNLVASPVFGMVGALSKRRNPYVTGNRRHQGVRLCRAPQPPSQKWVLAAAPSSRGRVGTVLTLPRRVRESSHLGQAEHWRICHGEQLWVACQRVAVMWTDRLLPPRLGLAGSRDCAQGKRAAGLREGLTSRFVLPPGSGIVG